MDEFDAASQRCLICGGRQLRRFQAQGYDTPDHALFGVVECETCAFAWQYPPARSDADSVAFFESAYRDQGKTGSEYFAHEGKHAIAKLQLAFISSLPVQGRTLLDVGAGAGILSSAAAAAGWQVTALDPAMQPAHANDPRPFVAFQGTLNDLPGDARFDIITLVDVIEHAREPVALLRAASRHLAPGGWLFLETGNYRCVDRVKAGPAHWIYQFDHRWYFSPHSVRHVLDAAGFTNARLCDLPLRPRDKAPTQVLSPSVWTLCKSLVRAPTRSRSRIAQWRELRAASQWELADTGVFGVAVQIGTHSLSA